MGKRFLILFLLVFFAPALGWAEDFSTGHVAPASNPLDGKARYYVDQWGAIPDDGLGDEAAFQALATIACANGGGDILFTPGGTYDFVDIEDHTGFNTIHVPCSNLRLSTKGRYPLATLTSDYDEGLTMMVICEGPGDGILVGCDSTTPIENTVIEFLRFKDSNPVGRTEGMAGIYLGYSRNTTVRDCVFEDLAGNNIMVKGDSGTKRAEDFHFYRNEFDGHNADDNSKAGIHIEIADGGKIYRNEFHSSPQTASPNRAVDIRLFPQSGETVHDVDVFDNFSHDTHINAFMDWLTTTDHLYDIRVGRNRIYNQHALGGSIIKGGSPNYWCIDCEITDNVFKSMGLGVHDVASAQLYVKNPLIRGNKFDGRLYDSEAEDDGCSSAHSTTVVCDTTQTDWVADQLIEYWMVIETGSCAGDSLEIDDNGTDWFSVTGGPLSCTPADGDDYIIMYHDNTASKQGDGISVHTTGDNTRILDNQIKFYPGRAINYAPSAAGENAIIARNLAFDVGHDSDPAIGSTAPTFVEGSVIVSENMVFCEDTTIDCIETDDWTNVAKLMKHGNLSNGTDDHDYTYNHAVFGGHIDTDWRGSVPTLSSCGGTPSAVTGGDSAGRFTVGTGTATCTLTFDQAFTTAPVCNVNGDGVTAAGANYDAVTTTTTMVTSVGVGTMSGDIIEYICIGLE